MSTLLAAENLSDNKYIDDVNLGVCLGFLAYRTSAITQAARP